MKLPLEVLFIIFSYLTPNDIMEASAVCKLIYHASRKSKLVAKKLDDSRKLFTCDKWTFDFHFRVVFISFSNQLFVYLEEYVNEEKLLQVKDILMKRLYHSVFLFRVWNHIFTCETLHDFFAMCRYWTRLCIKNRKISDHLKDSLFVQINDLPDQLK